MPHVCVVHSGTAQRRQLSETVAALEKKGFALSSKIEAKGEKNVSWASLFAASRSAGLFDAKQLMVIESAEGLGEFPAELEPFLDRLSETSSVVVCAFGAEIKKTFSPAATKKIGFVAKEENVAPWKRKDWIIRIANEQNIKIASDAAGLLAETVEDQEEIRGELAKLASFCAPKAITLDDVQNLSFDEGGRSLLKFLDGFSKRKVADVLASLEHLKRDPSPLPLLTALVNRVRPALYEAGASSYALGMAKQALAIYGKPAMQKFMLRMISLSITEKTNSAEGWAGFETAVILMLGSAK